VPAAGVGKRFGSAMPKQYLQLNGKTVVENTLERLLSLSEISQVVVGKATAFARMMPAIKARESQRRGIGWSK